MKKSLLVILLALPGVAFAKAPSCASWPTDMATTKLQNEGLIKRETLDESRTKATRLAVEKIGKDLYRQIFDIVIFQKDGTSFEVITDNQSSSEECSVSPVTIYLVSKNLGNR